MKPWQLLAFGIFLGLLSSALILLVISQPVGEPIQILPAPTLGPIMVDVAGEVLNPGLYTLPAGARVADGISAAGGLLDTANTNQINLAARLADGDKIWVPEVGQTVANIPDTTVRSTGFLININAASASEIETLPGIGEVKAGQIVSYRDEHGLFMSVEDLLNVPGIGPELLETIRPLITLSD